MLVNVHTLVYVPKRPRSKLFPFTLDILSYVEPNNAFEPAEEMKLPRTGSHRTHRHA